VVRRAIDFCRGLAFGRHGTLEKVADGIYLLVPPPGEPLL
jgi:FtsZ-interacting cell division protein YlmF